MQRARSGIVTIAALAALTAPGLRAEIWIDVGPEPAAPGRTSRARLSRGEFATPGSPTSADGRLQWIWRSGRRFLEPDARSGAFEIRPETDGLQLLAWQSPDGREFAKALVAAGPLREDDPLRWSELGQRLELVLQSDPARLQAGSEQVEIQVLFEREPLPSVVVEAFPAAGGESRRARTDEIGVARLRLPAPGGWLLRVAGGAGGCSATLVLRLER